VQWVRLQVKADAMPPSWDWSWRASFRREYALEGLLQEGWLRVLALFDKPDRSTAPISRNALHHASRLSQKKQDEIRQTVQHVCELPGLATGRSMRNASDEQAFGCWKSRALHRWLCGRMLRHTLGMSLEE